MKIPVMRHFSPSWAWFCGTLLLFFMLGTTDAFAHGVAEGDQGYVQEVSGVQFLPFMYLGAKHMVTGYDHLLFLCGVIFFLYKLKDIALYVTLFAVGHSATMLLGVLAGVGANAYMIDAIIGLSVVYKSLDNLGAYRRWFGVQPDTRLATFVFGLFHGFGLATKIQEFELSKDGLLPNLIAFNIGVEIRAIGCPFGNLNHHGFLAKDTQFWALCLCREYIADDGWVHARGLSTDWLGFSVRVFYVQFSTA